MLLCTKAARAWEKEKTLSLKHDLNSRLPRILTCSRRSDSKARRSDGGQRVKSYAGKTREKTKGVSPTLDQFCTERCLLFPFLLKKYLYLIEIRLFHLMFSDYAPSSQIARAPLGFFPLHQPGIAGWHRSLRILGRLGLFHP